MTGCGKDWRNLKSDCATANLGWFQAVPGSKWRILMYAYIYIYMYHYVSICNICSLQYHRLRWYFRENIIYMGFSWFFVERQPRSVPTVTSNCCCLNVAFSRSNSCWISELVKYGTWNWSESLYHGWSRETKAFSKTRTGIEIGENNEKQWKTCDRIPLNRIAACIIWIST